MTITVTGTADTPNTKVDEWTGQLSADLDALLARVSEAGPILRMLVRIGPEFGIHILTTLDTLTHSPEIQRLSSAFSLPIRTFQNTVDKQELVYGQFDSGLHQPEAMRRARTMPGKPAPRIEVLYEQ